MACVDCTMIEYVSVFAAAFVVVGAFALTAMAGLRALMNRKAG